MVWAGPQPAEAHILMDHSHLLRPRSHARGPGGPGNGNMREKHRPMSLESQENLDPLENPKDPGRLMEHRGLPSEKTETSKYTALNKRPGHGRPQTCGHRGYEGEGTQVPRCQVNQLIEHSPLRSFQEGR